MEKKWLALIKIGVFLAFLTPLVLTPLSAYFSGEFFKTIYFRTLVDITAILYLLFVFVYHKCLPKISKLGIAVLIFFAVLALSTFTGLNPYRSFFGDLEMSTGSEGLVTQLHLLLFFLILIGVFRKEGEWLGLFRWTVSVSVIPGVIGVLQILRYGNFYGVNAPERASGTLSNPDFFAPYLILIIFLGMFLVSAEQKKRFKVVWIAITVFNFVNLLLTVSRGGYIGVLIGLISFGLFIYHKQSERIRKKILISGFILSLGVLFVVLNLDSFLSENNYYYQRYISSFNFQSLGSRFLIWKVAVSAWLENPFLGWGSESFNFFYEKGYSSSFRTDIQSLDTFTRAHNKILDLLVSSGALGALSYITVFVLAVFRLLKNLKKNFYGSTILISLLIAYFFQNLFIFDNINSYILFFLVLGFLNNNLEDNSKSHDTEHATVPNNLYTRIIALAVIPLILFFLVEVNLKPAEASLLFCKGMSLQDKDYPAAISLYRNSAGKNTYYDKDLELIISKRLILNLDAGIYAQYNRQTMLVLSDIMSKFEPRLEKPDLQTVNSYIACAKYYELTYIVTHNVVALDNVEKIAYSLIEFNKDWPQFYVLLGERSILLKDYAGGERFFDKAFDLYFRDSNDYITHYQDLGNAYLRAGEINKAAGYLKKAADVIYFSRKYSKELNTKALSQAEMNAFFFMRSVAYMYSNGLKDSVTADLIYRRSAEVFPQASGMTYTN